MQDVGFGLLNRACARASAARLVGTETRSITRRPCQGRSAKARSYRLCPRSGGVAQSGLPAEPLAARLRRGHAGADALAEQLPLELGDARHDPVRVNVVAALVS